MMMPGESPDAAPLKAGFPVIDVAVGMLGALAIVAAVHRRSRAGLGQHIDASMLQASLMLMYPHAPAYLSRGIGPQRVGHRGYTGSPTADTYRCTDGWLATAANTPAQFRQLSAVPGLQALCSNGQAIATWRHSTPRAAASSWRAILPHLRGCFIEAFATRSAVEMEQQINAVGVPAARVRRLGGFLDEAQGMPGTGWQPTVYRQAPGAGEVRTPGLGFRYRFDGASDSAGAPAPGRDNQALLAALARPVPATPSADRAGAVPVSG